MSESFYQRADGPCGRGYDGIYSKKDVQQLQNKGETRENKVR